MRAIRLPSDRVLASRHRVGSSDTRVGRVSIRVLVISAFVTSRDNFGSCQVLAERIVVSTESEASISRAASEHH